MGGQGGEGSGSEELGRLPRLPRFPTRAKLLRRGARQSLAPEKPTNRPFLQGHVLGCFEQRAGQNFGASKATNRTFFGPLDARKRIVTNQSGPLSGIVCRE